MSKNAQGEPKHVHRLWPCPAYDIEAMESWLSDMAGDELSLSVAGFLPGFVVFERTEPCSVRYRLEAAPEHASIWDDNGGAPDVEARWLNKAYGWQYVTSRGQFHIYRSESADARELNTDPKVQALALDMVKKRERGNMVACFLLLMIYPIAKLQGNLLLTAYDIGAGLFLGAMALIIWAVSMSVARVIHLRRMRTRLSKGEAVDHRKNWRRAAGRHRIGSVLFIVLVFVWAGFLLHGLSNVAGASERRLADYGEELPFATIADLAPDGTFRLDDLASSNTIELGSDWLAPTIITLHEVATVELSDGGSLQRALRVDYYETVAPWLAREIAREYVSTGRRSANPYYVELPVSDLDVDYAFVYDNANPYISEDMTGTALVIQEGNKVIRVTFRQTFSKTSLQTSNSYAVSYGDWGRAVADSMKSSGS